MTSGIWLSDNCGVSEEPLTPQLERAQTPSKVFLREGVWGRGRASHLTSVQILGSREGLARAHINDTAAFAFADDVVLFLAPLERALAPRAADWCEARQHDAPPKKN